MQKFPTFISNVHQKNNHLNRTLFKHTLKHRHSWLTTKSPSVLIFWTPNGLFPTFEMIIFGNYQPPKLKHHARLRRIITSPEQNHLSCKITPNADKIKYTITNVIVYFMVGFVGQCSNFCKRNSKEATSMEAASFFLSG